jgi:hypothetical protein
MLAYDLLPPGLMRSLISKIGDRPTRRALH